MRQYPRYAGEISNRRLIYTVKHTDHTERELFENVLHSLSSSLGNLKTAAMMIQQAFDFHWSSFLTIKSKLRSNFCVFEFLRVV